MSTQSLDSDIYDYGFILNSTALHEAAMSVLVTTIYGRWRGTITNVLIAIGMYRKYGAKIADRAYGRTALEARKKAN